MPPLVCPAPPSSAAATEPAPEAPGLEPGAAAVGVSEPDPGVPRGKAVAAACLSLSVTRGQSWEPRVRSAWPAAHAVWLQAAGHVSSSAVTPARRSSARALWATSCWPTASPVKVMSPSSGDRTAGRCPRGPLLLLTSGQVPLCTTQGPSLGNSPGPASQHRWCLYHVRGEHEHRAGNWGWVWGLIGL